MLRSAGKLHDAPPRAVLFKQITIRQRAASVASGALAADAGRYDRAYTTSWCLPCIGMRRVVHARPFYRVSGFHPLTVATRPPAEI